MPRTHRRTHLVAASIAIALAATTPSRAAGDADAIGTATAITTTVTGTTAGATVALAAGDALFRNETIVTDASGVAQFGFRDRTRLAVGPGSTVVLDNFVYDSGGSASKWTINLAGGAMRFITGASDHAAYEIVTETATIGVRGTAFDIYAGPDGELAVAMLSGAIDICPTLGSCFRHDAIGKFLHMTAAGVFSLRDAWDGSFLAGVPFTTALPFLGDQKKLLPELRGKTATIAGYLALSSRIVKKRIIRLPKLKPPSLFGR
jgi:ferric-dicitrate binding protein FerR (iron transport regulator)